MPIPDFQTLMLPTLELAKDGNVHTLSEAREFLAKLFQLTEEDRNELLPSGTQRRFDNRVAWAKVYLGQAGLLASPKRAHFKITERGRELLSQKPSRIDIAALDQYEDFRKFRQGTKPEGPPVPGVGEVTVTGTPEEAMESAYASIRQSLSSDLLNKLKSATPEFFESLVVELLLKMGYGSSRAEAGRAIGKSGDEGIDGIISEDRLGLDNIYIQAKRWDGTVGRPEVQKFIGALHGKHARKGVFITTGTFSADARDYVKNIDPRIVLIDGELLTEYMIDNDLGVTTRSKYDIKRIDTDYFAEDA
jgi:restriction system protein